MTRQPVPVRLERMPLQKPSAEPLIPPEDAIAMALSCFVPGPADLISPRGRGVRMILHALKQSNHKIVAMTREDIEG